METLYAQKLAEKKDLPGVPHMKCRRTGNLTTKKTKSHGTTYEYYYVPRYIKETDKIEWCYLGRCDKLPQGYKDKPKQSPLHKNPSYTQNYTQTSTNSEKPKSRPFYRTNSAHRSGRSLVWLGHQPATLTTRVQIPAAAPHSFSLHTLR